MGVACFFILFVVIYIHGFNTIDVTSNKRSSQEGRFVIEKRPFVIVTYTFSGYSRRPSLLFATPGNSYTHTQLVAQNISQNMPIYDGVCRLF